MTQILAYSLFSYFRSNYSSNPLPMAWKFLKTSCVTLWITFFFFQLTASLQSELLVARDTHHVTDSACVLSPGWGNMLTDQPHYKHWAALNHRAPGNRAHLTEQPPCLFLKPDFRRNLIYGSFLGWTSFQKLFKQMLCLCFRTFNNYPIFSVNAWIIKRFSHRV